MNLEIISVILSIIILICFFILCINVSAIKKSVNVPQPWQASFSLYCSTGQIEKARDVLLKAIMHDSDCARGFYLNVPDRLDVQKRIEARYGEYLKIVDLTIDFNKVNDFISKF